MTYNPNGALDIDTSELDAAGLVPMNQEGGESAAAETVVDIPVDPELLASTLASVAEATDPTPDLHAEAEIAVLNAELGVAPAKNETGFSEEFSAQSQEIAGLMSKRDEMTANRRSGGVSGIELDNIDSEIAKLQDAQREMLRNRASTSQTESASKKPVESQGDNGAETSIETPQTNQEELYADWIKHSASMRDVMGGLSRFGDITAPDGHVYKNSELIQLIASLSGPEDPNLQKVTRTHGLRDKVREILSSKR